MIRAALAAALALALLALAPGGAAPAAAAGCPNEERRVEQGALALRLPDCRAYELVSPGSLASQERFARASSSGDAIAYYTSHPADEAATSSYFYLSTRSASGWGARSAAPQDVPGAYFEDQCDQSVYFSPDFSLSVVEDGWLEPGEPLRCKHNEDVLAPGERVPFRNVFLREEAGGHYRLLNLTPEGAAAANAKFQDASDDFGLVVFSEEARLTADAPAAGRVFYAWSEGAVRLLTYLPDGSPAAGELVEAAGYRPLAGGTVPGTGFAPVTGAVSADGERVFFHAGGMLLMRLHPGRPPSPVLAGECIDPELACSVQIDASQGPGPGGGGVFWGASADGSKVVFSAESRLTADSSAVAGKPDLYVYDVDTGQLSDLTASGGEPADVRGVSAIAEDGSHVYFVANGVLAAGAAPGDCSGADAPGQSCNLYLARAGSVAHVATLDRADRAVWRETFEPPRKAGFVEANVSPNGRFLAFTSQRSLTGYDNRDAEESQVLNQEAFLYDAGEGAAAGRLSCVSCPPGPAHAPVALAAVGSYASSTPGGTALWRVNSVLDDGRVFFDTEDALVAADLNGLQRDVYEYRGGELRLLSGGAHAGPARFRDAGRDGRDVFFSTAAQLLPTDLDRDNTSIYDARVGGGFHFPSPPPPGCGGEECRGAVFLPPPFAPPWTSSFSPPARADGRPRGKRRHKQRRAKRRHERQRGQGRGQSRRGPGGRATAGVRR